jgi:hypothetical protein
LDEMVIVGRNLGPFRHDAVAFPMPADAGPTFQVDLHNGRP